MRFLRHAARPGLLAATALLAVPLPVPGPAPSPGLALKLTGAQGSWTRAATLSCDPMPHGSHPLPTPACTALSAAGGDFDALPGQPTVCRDPYAPVVATAKGDYHGQPVTWRKKFANSCILHAATGPVFAF